MKLKDATRNFGSVGILLPLILIFLIAAGSTFACPGKRVVYRTRTASSRSVPSMGTTVITYGGQPCDQSVYAPRSTRYVAVRGNTYYSTAPRYVAVRTAEKYYPARRVRYVAVRNDDIDDAPARYVVVRRQPAYVESRVRYAAVDSDRFADASRYVPVDTYDINGRHVMRYAAVRSGYRTGNGIVGYVDVDDAPRYVAVRRQPVYVTGSRYVAVRHVDNDYDDDDYVGPTRYVAVRNVSNACACGVSSLNDVEAAAPRHVVVKTDYVAGTRDVIVPRSSYDDTAYLTMPSENITRTAYLDTTDAAYWDDSNATFVPASYAVSPQVATMSYVPADEDSDFDDEAIPDTSDVTYVTTDDVADACLSRVAVQAPMEMSTQTISYVPVDDVDYDASLSGSEPTYITNETVPAISYVPASNENSNVETTYVDAGNIGASCSCPVALQSPVALRTFEDDLGYHTVTAIPADNLAAVNTVPVSYASTEDVNYVPADETNIEDVNYVAADETNVEPVSYMPSASVDTADTTDMDADDRPISDTSVVAEPVSNADTSTAIIEPVDTDMSAELSATQAAAQDVGYRDGLADGKAAAINGDENRPGDAANFQNPTNGYTDALGDANAYGDAYRSSYLQGFSDGYNSEIGP